MKFKEVFRIILLAIAILILLVIALYEYVPSSITLTEVTPYKQLGETANIIKQVSDTTSGEEEANESIIKSYTVTEQDLKRYEGTYKYNSGRGNPFQNLVYNPVVTSGTVGNSITDPTGSTNSINTATGYFNSTGKNK